MSEDSGSEYLLTRRQFLKLMGGTALTGVVGSMFTARLPFNVPFLEPVYFLQRTEWSNLVLLENIVEMLSGASESDWAYRPDHSFGVIENVLASTEAFEQLSDPFQRLCPDEYLISTPYDDSKALITKHGKLSVFNNGHTHHIPYFINGTTLHDGSREQGGFAGIELDGDVYWLFDAFDRVSTEVIDHGIVKHVFKHSETGLKVSQTAYMPFGSETVRLDYEVENTSNTRMDGAFVFHLQANANRRMQTPIVFKTSWNHATAGETITWQDQENDAELYMSLFDADGQPAEHTGVAAASITSQDREKARQLAGSITRKRPYLQRYIDNLIREEPYPLPTGTAFEHILTDAVNEIAGRYISGIQQSSFSVAPGRTTQFSAMITEQDRVEWVPQTDAQQQNRRNWQNWVSRADLTGVPDEFQEQAKHSLATLFKNWVPSVNAFQAAPHLQPTYYFVWPRDNIASAMAAARFGFTDSAISTMTTFLPQIQEDDGSFKQCYMTDGTDANLYKEAYDQPAQFVLATFGLQEITGKNIVSELDSELRAAVDYLTTNIADNGLMKPCYDFRENPWEVHTSLYTNSLVLAAFRSAQNGLDMDLQNEISRLERGINRHLLVSEDNWYNAIQFTGRSQDYDGMGTFAYTVGILDNPSYLEDVFEHVGIDTVEHTWTVATNHLAGAAALMGDRVLTVNGQQYTGRELAARRLNANITHASEHGAFFEKVDGNRRATDARHLTMSHAEFLSAVHELRT